MPASPPSKAPYRGPARLVLVTSLLFGLVTGWLNLDFLEQALFLATEGQPVDAVVTALETDRVTARYRVGPVTYDRRFPSDGALILGDPVTVTYLLSDPASATLDPAGMRRMALVMAAAISVSVLAGLAGLWRLSRR